MAEPQQETVPVSKPGTRVIHEPAVGSMIGSYRVPPNTAWVVVDEFDRVITTRIRLPSVRRVAFR